MDYSWKVLNEIKFPEPIPKENFWNGINVWIERPHVLNRRVLAAEILESRIISQNDILSDCLTKKILELYMKQTLNLETLHHSIQELNNYNQFIKTSCIKFDKTIIIHAENSILMLRNLISRNKKLYQDLAEVLLLDKSECSISFYPMQSEALLYQLSPNFPYKIKLSDNKLSIEVLQNDSKIQLPEVLKAEQWLASDVLSKIFKWCQSSLNEVHSLQSLSLISAANYNSVLHHLKEKYGSYYTKIWPKYNNTDPLKYVYEDISICAYLITLWEEERAKNNLNKKQTFVDLACGNGLLVDILTSEGYEGIGIDLRKRKIWEAFQCKKNLIEMTIQPSNYHLFPNHDWIIGNHPDELTPWIPIIAARSNYKMRIFLMPCCYYTFNGKFDRCDRGFSRYQSYLNFIHGLCQTVGFNVQQDRLRIPSTKRNCFVCSSRSYGETEEAKMDIIRNELLKRDSSFLNAPLKKDGCFCKDMEISTVSDIWSSSFKPREKKEAVKNCTDIDKNVIRSIVFAVVRILLSEKNYKLVERDNETIPWNAGGIAIMHELINMVDSNLLSCLKNQNGGFQTLLRNHRHIFEIKDGYVKIKVPRKCYCSEQSDGNVCSCKKRILAVYKTKECFFHFYHPQGCPISSSNCNYSHKKLEED